MAVGWPVRVYREGLTKGWLALSPAKNLPRRGILQGDGDASVGEGSQVHQLLDPVVKERIHRRQQQELCGPEISRDQQRSGKRDTQERRSIDGRGVLAQCSRRYAGMA